MSIVTRFFSTATNMIRLDHTHVLSTFHQYKASAPSRVKKGLANTICTALEVHAKLEEEIFYPAIREVSDNDVLGESVNEHQEMRRLISLRRRMEPEAIDYDDTVMALMRHVMHHVADEETVVLPEAEKLLKDAWRSGSQDDEAPRPTCRSAHRRDRPGYGPRRLRERRRNLPRRRHRHLSSVFGGPTDPGLQEVARGCACVHPDEGYTKTIAGGPNEFFLLLSSSRPLAAAREKGTGGRKAAGLGAGHLFDTALPFAVDRMVAHEHFVIGGSSQARALQGSGRSKDAHPGNRGGSGLPQRG